MNINHGPGPAAYDVSHGQTLSRKPAYSMPKDAKFVKAQSKSPGPAEYKSNIEAIRAKRAEHTIALRPPSRNKDETPGPSNYRTDVSFADQNRKAQSFTKQIVHNKPKPEPTPGPSLYHPKEQKPRVPAYSMRKKTDDHSEIGTDEYVGPSSYDVLVNNSFSHQQHYTSTTPGRTMGERHNKFDPTTSPGPDAYTTNRDANFDIPSYTFGVSRSTKRLERTPGPAEYDPDSAQRKIISKTMSAKSLHGSVYTTNSNPGPAAYNQPTTSVLSKSASSPALRIPTEKRFHKSSAAMSTPGPGAYSNGVTAIKQKKSGPSFTMAGRWKSPKDARGGPGPAPMGRYIDAPSYNSALKSRNPAYSIPKTTQTAKKYRAKHDTTPGPGSYFDRAEQSGTIRRSASAIELSRPRGMAFGLKARSKTPDMSPGPASYSPYDSLQLGTTGNKHTMKSRSPHPDAITTSVYSQTLTRPTRSKKMMTKTKQRPIAQAAY